MRDSDDLIYERDGAIVTITLNRPQVLNAVSIELGRDLREAMADFEADSRLRVAIVTGTGTKAFCAGGDLKSSIPSVTTSSGADLGDPATRQFSDITKPIIAAVNGLALGGGMEIVLGTDIRVAADHAVFGLPESSVGLVPFGGAHIRLPQQIPWAIAMEALLTGEPISAQRAYEVGLINRVVPSDQVMAESIRMAERICENGPLAVRTTKAIVLAAYNLSWREAFMVETEMSATVLASQDAKDGLAAFAEKRRPNFTGR